MATVVYIGFSGFELGAEAPYVTNQSPAPGPRLDVSQTLGWDVTDDGAAVDLSQVRIYATRTGTEELVWDGSSYQAPWTGDAPTAQGNGWRWANVGRGGNWFEDVDLVMRATAVAMNESWSYEVETLGFFRNSGAEAPGVDATKAKAWSTSGDAGTEGTDWGRVADVAAPEGGYVLKMGASGISDPGVWRTSTVPTDLTGVAFISFYPRHDHDLDAGDVLWFKVYVDGDEIYSREITADLLEDWGGLLQVPLGAVYTGDHVVKFLAVYLPSGQQAWVPELVEGLGADGEQFDYWSGDLQLWNGGTAQPMLADGEQFDAWGGELQLWDGASHQPMMADGEQFDDWAT